jgi:hypothetical protein
MKTLKEGSTEVHKGAVVSQMMKEGCKPVWTLPTAGQLARVSTLKHEVLSKAL